MFKNLWSNFNAILDCTGQFALIKLSLPTVKNKWHIFVQTCHILTTWYSGSSRWCFSNRNRSCKL